MKKFFLSLVAILATISMFGQDRLNIYFADETGAQVRKIEATLGEPFNAPHLVFEPAEAERSVRVQYASQNPNVAEIDMMSGRIELKGEGSTYITATTGQTEQYLSASARYNLIVEAPHDTTPVEPPTCPEAYFYQNGERLKTLTIHKGEAVSLPMLLTATGSVYTSYQAYTDSANIAIVTADNLLYGVNEGYATLWGTIYASAEGEMLSCDYALPILVSGQGPQQKEKPELAFEPQEVTIEYGDPVVVPQIVNPHNITFTPNNSKWYTAWDSKVARVDEATGEVTILDVGDEIISFEFTGNDAFEGQIISYDLHVTTMGLTVGGFVVNNSNKDDILGDNGSITYDPITHTLTMTNAFIDGLGYNMTPARVKGAKDDVLPEANIIYTDKAPLTIVLIGGNALTTAEAGILSQFAPVVMMSPEGAYGTIRISGYTVGIKAEALKLYKCGVSTYGYAAGVAVGELAVASGANLFAQGSGLAIQANSLIMAEDNNGEGIAILTEGVTFEKGKGFFKDGKVATVVEIGKVPVVVPDDEVTTIDFTQTDPEGNETVVFSTSVNDTYNEETGQLEISTSLTDEQVEEALENLVPGSSAWIDMLPGSLVFDIPAGEGKVRINCMTLPGYKLQVKIEGQAAISVQMVALGWAEVSYNVAQPMHVVIYLHAEGGASAPARIIARTADDPAAGAYIQAIEIAPKNAPEGIEHIDAERLENGAKLLLDGQLYIIREGRIFNANGAQVR